MNIFLSIISIFAFIKTISYGIFELKENNNKMASVLVIALGIIGTLFFNIILWFIY